MGKKSQTTLHWNWSYSCWDEKRTINYTDSNALELIHWFKCSKLRNIKPQFEDFYNLKSEWIFKKNDPFKTLKKLGLNTHLAWVEKEKSDILNQSYIPYLKLWLEKIHNIGNKNEIFDNLQLITDPVSCELRQWGDELLFTLISPISTFGWCSLLLSCQLLPERIQAGSLHHPTLVHQYSYQSFPVFPNSLSPRSSCRENMRYQV